MSKHKMEIMLGKRSHFLVLFVLFAFCGQAMAMPFMTCCLELNDTKLDSTESHSHMMRMNGNNHHQDAHQLAMDKHAPNNHGSNMAVEHGLANCNHHCDMCLGSATTQLIENIVAVPKGALVPNATYSFFHSSTSTENPFRPPITA